MQEFTTPMMKQYQGIKEQYKDCLLFFRMGDFYELFLEDAVIGARVLNITLTSKPIGKGERIPMAGVPYHAADNYLTKLVSAGYKVAICEQLSPPNKYGLVERDVIRIVTPGTQLNESALDKKQNNYIVSLDIEDKLLSIAISDVSTGFFAVIEKPYDNLEQAIKEETGKYNIVECILSNQEYNNFELLKILKTHKKLNIFSFPNAQNYKDNPKKILKEHFSIATLAAFSLEDKPLSQRTCAMLLGYLKETQKSSLSHIRKITLLSDEDYMLLDRSTMINLELFSTIREHDTKGSLLNVLDQTITAMGGRLLKEWLSRPLREKDQIEQRYEAIEELLKDYSKKEDFKEILKQIPDVERILSRLSVGLGNARDLLTLKLSLSQILKVKNNLAKSSSSLLKKINKEISSELQELISLIDKSIVEEPPVDTKIGGMFQSEVSEKLIKLRQIINGSKDWIKELERSERERTGISTLKVRFNKVFGFYIEISKGSAHLAPDNYLRKQTLVNGERFITTELKKQEELVLSAEEKLSDLEYKLFLELVEKILKKTSIIQQAATSIAIFDCLFNFAVISEKHRYVKPKLLYSGEIKIKNGRHPVVEKLLEENQFVPNDVTLDNIHSQLLLITGPNMAGKSVFIRQVALLVLMAQIGCFIPAESAYISIADRIFVRSGASDVITSGLSTFMVEMVETAYILNNATENSLIIMDEIGRGTSTYDGISIAWAITEFLVTRFKKSPKTLFATHYHELQRLEEEYPQKIKNYSMAVSQNNGDPVFLYTVVKGAASHSFGVAVASLAGLPQEVIQKSQQKLLELEDKHDKKIITKIDDFPKVVIEEQQIFEHILYKELENIDIHQMTPLEALNKLSELKDKTKIIKEETKNFIGSD